MAQMICTRRIQRALCTSSAQVVATTPMSIVDAFTHVPFQGNPAAVALLRHVEHDFWPLTDPALDSWMQRVAAEMNLSETAFLTKQGNSKFGLRWWTPTEEVDLCGHATLASSHFLWEAGHADPALPIHFETRSGALIATAQGGKYRPGGWIRLDFPSEEQSQVLTQSDPEFEIIGRSLGLPPAQLLHVGRNRMDIFVEIARDVFDAHFQPTQMPNFSALDDVENCRVLSITASAGGEADDYDFISRFFAPWCGVLEDPVCGSAHCLLGPYWSAKLGKSTLTALAGSQRGGMLRVVIDGNDTKRVTLEGQAVTALKGHLMAMP